MRRVSWPVVGAFLVSFMVTAAGTSAAPSAATSDRPVRWLALGDSFSSGEGIPGASAGNPQLQGEGNCQRANGDNTEAKAYSVVAAEDLQLQPPAGFSYERPFFVACTGAITDDVSTQLAEMRAQVPPDLQQWDVASLSFGGNNILFGPVIEDCLDLKDLWGAVVYEGCSTSEQRLRERVEMLAGTRPIVDGEFDGVMTLPELYDEVAAAMRPGGHVMVVGYPHLIEEPERWSSWIQRRSLGCQGILKDDVRMLRSVTGYLNEQIGRAVLAADEEWASKGVSFHFIDISTTVYETSAAGGDRHGLCADDQWINGITTGVTSGDFRKERSFHPTQSGHTATGRYLADLLRNTITFPPSCDAAGIGDDLGVGAIEVIDGLCRDGWAYVDTVDGLGDSQMIVRHDGTAWIVYTYFPSALCAADALAAGAPSEIVERVGWVCFNSSDPEVISPDRRSGLTLVQCGAEVSADLGENIEATCSGEWATGWTLEYQQSCADCDYLTVFHQVGGVWTESGGCLYRSVIIAGSKGCPEMWHVPPEVLCEVWLNSDLGALWETGCPPWRDSLERAQTESCTYYGELDPTDDFWAPAFGPCKQGPLAQQVQERLLELGYELDADGYFGPQSARAMAQFQRDQGLTISAVIDPPSITALLG